MLLYLVWSVVRRSVSWSMNIGSVEFWQLEGGWYMTTTVKFGISFWLILQTACSKLLYSVKSCCSILMFFMVTAIPFPFPVFLLIGSVWKSFLFSSDPRNHCWSSSVSLSQVSVVTSRSILYSFKALRMLSSFGLIDLTLIVANWKFFENKLIFFQTLWQKREFPPVGFEPDASRLPDERPNR